MLNKILVFMLIISLMLVGCSKKENNNSEEQQTGDCTVDARENITESNNVTEINNNNLGLITGNNVRIRAKESLNSEIIVELEKWTKVVITGRSKEKQKIGEYNDYWYQIKIDDLTGWCYGHFLLSTNNLSNDEITNLKDIFESNENYIQSKNILKAISLNIKDKQYIDNGIRKLVDLKEAHGVRLSERVFSNIERVTFWKYSTSELNDPSKITEEPLKQAVNKIREEGFRININDGDPELQVNPKDIVTEFQNYVSKPLMDYMLLVSKEVEEPIAEEGFIIVTWDEIAKRLAKWDSYIQENKGIIEAEIAKEKYYDPYLYIYIHGTYNTPVFKENGQLIDEAKNSFKNFIEENKDLESYKIITEYYKLLKKNKYTKNYEIENFLKNLF